MIKEEAIKRFETLLLHVDTDCAMGAVSIACGSVTGVAHG